MVTELRDLMNATANQLPAEPLDAFGLLDEGRRRVRRRRSTVIAGVAAAAAIVVVGTFGLVHSGGGAHVPPTTQHHDGPTVHVSDATPAIAGRDYDRLGTYTDETLDTENGRTFVQFLADGSVLFVDGPTGPHNLVDVGITDPQSPGLAPDRYFENVPTELSPADAAAADSRWVVMVQSQDGGIAVVDRATGLTSTLPLTDVVGEDDLPFLRILGFGDDGRLYFTRLDIMHTGVPPPVWAVDLADPSSVEMVGQGFSVALVGGDLVSFDAPDPGLSTLNVTQVSTGETTTIPSHLSDTCNPLALWPMGSSAVALQAYCGTHGEVRDDRILVLTTDGHLVATIQDTSIDVATTSSRFLTFTKHDDPGAGTYLFEPSTLRLLRLSDAMHHFDTRVASGGEDVANWAVPVNDGHGLEFTFAEFN